MLRPTPLRPPAARRLDPAAGIVVVFGVAALAIVGCRAPGGPADDGRVGGATSAGAVAPADGVSVPTAPSTAATAADVSADGSAAAPTRAVAPKDLAPPTLADLGVADGLGFDGVALASIDDPAGRPLWAAYTTGARSFDPDQPHVLAVIEPDGGDDGTWRIVARVELGAAAPGGGATPDPDAYFGPDYLSGGSVAQVEVEPGHIWLGVDGGIGAHGGSFALWSFDGSALTLQAHATNSTPGGGRVEDLDGDGVGEVLIDQTDAYVFCYACGVREAHVDVRVWDGQRLVGLPPPDAPTRAGDGAALEGAADVATTDPPARAAVEAARAAARAGLWAAAVAAIDDAARRAPDDAGIRRLALAIRANADARRRLATADGGAPYPLLHRLFYGDWLGAVAPCRDMPPPRLFAADSPLVAGTPAEGWVTDLATRIAAAAGGVIEPDGGALPPPPYLADDPAALAAAARFLRGWSAWLAAPGSAAARADIAAAAALAPDDPLYAASAAWIAGQP